MNNKVCILAIESSCDDTGAAVIQNGLLKSNVIAGQSIHSKHGGVVPELASRDHNKNIVWVVKQALKEAEVEQKELDAIAVTAGPGLLGSLLVGVAYAKGLALGLNKPLIAVNHIEAHILSHFINDPKPQFPFMCLLVSGGHTQIVLLANALEQKIIGRTTDDAAGEAFDKGAKILDLPYPGGPIIDKLAKTGNDEAFDFKKPKVAGYDYSFSGLKTALLYFLRDELKHNKKFIDEHIHDLAASWQRVIVDYLLENFSKAIAEYDVKHIGIAGGVAANSYLRTALLKLAENKDLKAYVPEFEFCVDNAGMIAKAAEFKYFKQDFASIDFKPFTRSGSET